MKKILKSFPLIIVGILITTSIFLLGFTNIKTLEPMDLYHVYLDGENIGIITSKMELENYIDNEQQVIKDTYNVDKVYAPNGLEILKEWTYSENVLSASEVYEKIKGIKPFTINGYVINITNDDSAEKIYTLNDEYFKSAVNTTIKIFLGEDSYETFFTDTQIEIKEFGSIVEDVYIGETVTIQEEHISIDENIITNKDDMAKYILFGTLKQQSIYKVKPGDTITTVAENNKLHTEEFLVANPEFTSIDNLLHPGQEVVIGLIKPQISVVVEKHVVEKQIKTFETKIKYDNSVLVGSGYESQAGVNGEDKVTQKIKYINGAPQTAVIVSTEELKPVINSVYVKGGKIIPYVGDSRYWGWPTIKHYVITSDFGWRKGRQHQGIDISGCGHGSPIYAANNGTVSIKDYERYGYGNWVEINHNNGYKTRYGHMSKIYVVKGQVVEKGQVIGTMGNTGRSTGTHLHFEIRYNNKAYNPRNYYN